MIAEELKTKTASSLIWSILRALSDQIFSFAVFVILSRLLSPTEVGIFAIGFICFEIGRILSTGGVVHVVARLKRQDEPADHIFWSAVFRALLFFTTLAIAAALLFARGNDGRMPAILLALGLCVVVNAAGATHMALRLREFGHRTMAVRSLLSGVIGGGLGIAAALAGFGVWSLVVQRVAIEAITAVLAWRAFRWRPPRPSAPPSIHGDGALGRSVMILQLLALGLIRAQDVLVGALLGVGAVGIYRVAWRCVEVIANGASQPFSVVAIQTLARLQDQSAALRHAFRSMLRLAASVAFPALLGFGSVAVTLVPLLFGDKWRAAGDLGMIFSLLAIPMTIDAFVSPALAAVGDGRTMRRLGLVQLLLPVCSTLLLARHGLVWIVAGYVACSYLCLPLQLAAIRRALGIRARDVAAAIARPLAASLLMCLFVGLVTRFGADRSPTTLAIAILGGAAVYVPLLLLLSPDLRRIAVTGIRRAAV